MLPRSVVLVLASVLLLGACAEVPVAPSDEEVPSVGMLRIVPDEDHGAFVEELRRQGFEVGSAVELLPEDPDRLYADAGEAEAALRRWMPDGLDLVVAFSTPFAQLVAELDGAPPGLFVVNDPVASGLVTDRDHPDGPMTGVTFRTPADRTLDLAAQALGGLERLGYLWPADDPAVPGHREALLAAAEELGVEVVERSFGDESEIAALVDELVSSDVEAVALPNANATFRAMDELREALDGARLPVIANLDLVDFAVVILTPDGEELRRQLARQAARILGGTDVSNIPVEDPRKFTLIVNQTKARELGLPDLPQGLVRQADVVR